MMVSDLVILIIVFGVLNKLDGMTLLTCDARIAAYPGPILFAGKPEQ